MSLLAVTDLALPGLKLLVPRVFSDERGRFVETWNRARMREHGLDLDFVQDNQSLSTETGTIRGLHFQAPPHAQGKLVRVIVGAVRDVVVDLRHSSPAFGRHIAVELSAEGGEQLWVPEGFAHGFVTLQPGTIVAYKVTRPYAPEADGGVAFDDPALAIDWGLDPAAARLSAKDRRHPRLADLPVLFS